MLVWNSKKVMIALHEVSSEPNPGVYSCPEYDLLSIEKSPPSSVWTNTNVLVTFLEKSMDTSPSPLYCLCSNTDLKCVCVCVGGGGGGGDTFEGGGEVPPYKSLLVSCQFT